MKKVSFTVRRIWYDQIVAGTKTSEWRQGKRWTWLGGGPGKTPQEAVFLCGRQPVHRREVWFVRVHDHTDSEMPDMFRDKATPADPVYEIVLGEEVHNIDINKCTCTQHQKRGRNG